MTNTLLRVTQMNAIYFDNEIVKIFLEQVRDCMKYLQPGYSALYSDEITLSLKLVILGYSILKCDSTFGQKLLSIKYENITNLKKVMLLAGLVMEYLVEKLGKFDKEPFTNSNLTKLKALVYFCSLVNICVFLRNGKKPRLIERVLCLNQIHSKNVQRQYDSHYMTRELLWDSFIEILLYTLPLVNYYKLKRLLKSLNPFHMKVDLPEAINPVMTLNTKCPHCNDFPVLPHHMGCAHVFCYTCLKGNQVADPKYECPQCQYTSHESLCKRVV